MSAFGNYLKDDIVDSIKNFVSDKKEDNPEIQINQLVKEVMEAVSYGLESSIYKIENEKE